MIKLLIPILIVSIACGNGNKAIQQARLDEVMAIHDALMPHMGTIRNLQKDIKTKVELIASIDCTGNGQAELEILSRDLSEANENMMNWMRIFSRLSNKKSHQEIMDYYTQEFDNINAVKKQMLDAVENGRQGLGQH